MYKVPFGSHVSHWSWEQHMRIQRLFFSLTLLALTAVECNAADLSVIPRVINKEPAYRTGKPKYCLLVFGPEAKTRVWLVQDGDTLYVDRNGNGDLTEEGERVVAEERVGAAEENYAFKIGTIQDGVPRHKEVVVFTGKIDHLADNYPAVKEFLAKNPNGRGYGLRAEIEMPEWKGIGVGGRVIQNATYVDARGVLQFGDTAAQAPVVHFGGPWQIALFGHSALTVNRETDVVLGVGTAGVGPGTTAWIGYEGVIPEKVYPTLDITYPPLKSGQPPLRAHYELKRRC